VIKSILIVCSGNICRSPIAEALLRHRLDGRTPVASAGITALVGHPADPIAVELCREAGLDITGHRAQQATAPLLNDHDLILTLSQDHSDWIHRFHPQLRGRTHKLLRWRDNEDVIDPYRQPRAVFERAYEDIDAGVADWVSRLKR
jgi:protein-tyrosine phosphatase